MNKSCVLAYSGGLDTSVILGWLQDQGYDVHAVYVDLGQPCEDRDAIMQKAKDCGASMAFLILLRLPSEVLEVFEERLRESLPLSADKVMSLLAGMRNGDVQDARFHDRLRGQGPRWQLIEQLFAVHCKKLGLDGRERRIVGKKKAPPTQGSLFGTQ